MNRRGRLLITRPADDAGPLMDLLREQDFDTIGEPMLTIVHEAGPPPDLTGVQALLMTSANGVRAFAARSGERRVPVLAVGDATARAANEAGFIQVSSADGDVGDLARLAASRLTPSDGALLHVAGTRVAGDLAGQLEAAGFVYRRAVLYHTETARELSAATATAIARKSVAGVIFFSPRTAATFVRLLERAGLVAAAEAMDAFCLSPAVAEAACVPRWRRVMVAEHPDQESLLACVTAGTWDKSAAGR